MKATFRVLQYCALTVSLLGLVLGHFQKNPEKAQSQNNSSAMLFFVAVGVEAFILGFDQNNVRENQKEILDNQEKILQALQKQPLLAVISIGATSDAGEEPIVSSEEENNSDA